MDIASVINHLFPSAVVNVDFRVQDDGDGPFIVEWNLAAKKPSDAEMMAAEKYASKKIMWERIKAERDRRSSCGGYKVGNIWFHSDQKSRNQQLCLAQLETQIADNLLWKTMDGTFVVMSKTLVQNILAAATSNDQAIFSTAEFHKVAMESIADPASYDFSNGWPKMFCN